MEGQGQKKVEECVENLLKFRKDQYKEEDELILAMKELNQRCQELKMTQDEWYAVWMLEKMSKRKRMDNFEIETLRDVVKEGGADVIDKFEKKFKEIKVEEKKEGTFIHNVL